MATKARKPEPTRPALSGLLPDDQTPGRSVTIADWIIEQINAGVDPINAAGTAGVTPAELQAWMREGSLVFARLNSGADWAKDFVPFQQDCAVFADRLIRARSAHIARLTVVAEQVARGGITRKSTRTKTIPGPPDANGQPTRIVAESVETTEVTLPDPDMVKWKLEKLEPAVYGQKATLNVTVTDLTDTEAQADNVAAKMAQVAASLLAAIETTATESGEGSPDSGVETGPATTQRATPQVEP